MTLKAPDTPRPTPKLPKDGMRVFAQHLRGCHAGIEPNEDFDALIKLRVGVLEDRCVERTSALPRAIDRENKTAAGTYFRVYGLV